ncbi:hypothetical protein ACN99C_25415 [Pseudomonas alloputida]
MLGRLSLHLSLQGEQLWPSICRGANCYDSQGEIDAVSFDL